MTETLSLAEYRKLYGQKKKKGHKYNAEKYRVGGNEFPSKLEGAVYELLLLRERAGEIRDIRRQSSIRLKDKCKECGSQAVVWKVDFSFIDVETGEKIYCEAKGSEGDDYKRRKRLWKANPPAKLEIWKGSYRNPRLVEVIEK